MKFESEPNNDLGKYIHNAVEAYLAKRHDEFWMDYAEEVGCSIMEVIDEESDLHYLYFTHITTPFGGEEYLSVLVTCCFDDDRFDINFSVYAKDEIGKTGITEVLDSD